MTRTKAVRAVFGTTLGTSVAGIGQLVIDPYTALYPFGTTVRITAVPQPGNYFVRWGDDASGTNNPMSFVVTNAGSAVSSLFNALSTGQFTLTTVANGAGQVIRTPQANRYTNGQSVTIRALSDAGQIFTGWSGDTNGVQNPLILLMNQDRVIFGNFSSRPRLSLRRPLLSGEGAQVSFPGELGRDYTIQATTNLLDWLSLAKITNSLGSVEFEDSSSTNLSFRFYRALSGPP
jgi:hypothetical protein